MTDTRMRASLDGWAFALAGPRVLVGKLLPTTSGGQKLSPVYEAKCTFSVKGAGTEITRTVDVVPLLGFATIDEVDLPTGTVTIPLEKLSDQEIEEMVGQLERANLFIAAMRRPAQRLVKPGGRA